jgi:hypothetical protein
MMEMRKLGPLSLETSGERYGAAMMSQVER